MRPPSNMLLRALRSSIAPETVSRSNFAPTRGTILTQRNRFSTSSSLRSPIENDKPESSSSPKNDDETSSTPSKSIPKPKQTLPQPPSHPDRSLSAPSRRAPSARVPKSDHAVSSEPHQTDFNLLDVYAEMPTPSTAIDACAHDGFEFNSGVTISGGFGALLVGGEAFTWRPWGREGDDGQGGMRGVEGVINAKGQFEVPDEAWGVLEVVWPRPDLLVLGLGASNYPLAPATRAKIQSLGMSVDAQDTRNAAAMFNLLATERGVESVAAALIPIGFSGKVGRR